MTSNPTIQLDPTDRRVALPLYTVREVARYLSMPPSTLQHWIADRGLVTAHAVRGHRPSVPFVGFAEAFVLKAALQAGVPEHRIKPGVEAIKAELPIDHALAHKRVFTDGAELLLRFFDGDDLEVPRLKQRQLTATVTDQLRLISYADDGFASRLQLPRYQALVTVDPSVAAGRPLLESAGARVKDLIDRFEGGDSEEAIARDFEVPIEEVREVVRSS